MWKRNILIEQINKKELEKLDIVDLRQLRTRFINIYDKYFIKYNMQKAAGMARVEFMAKYNLLRKELNDRGVEPSPHQQIDQELGRMLFKSVMYGLDISMLNDMLVIPDYVSISGDFISSPTKAGKIKIIIKNKEENRNEKFEGVIEQLIKNQTRKELVFAYDPRGPDSSYIPIFDLILKTHDEIKKVNIEKKEPEKKVKEKKAFPIKKPEETENTIRIPVGPDCEVTATITIDKGQGISALYCGKVKKIRTFIFDKKKKAWTMASARAWVKENKAKAEKSIDKKLEEVRLAGDFTKGVEKDTIFKIMKIDKKEQIIGGIVYEPDEVDTQGDYADAKEIEKAMYRFMEKYATDTKRARINHEGKRYHFPILECFQPEEDTIKGDKPLKKGSWWLMMKVTNKDIWNKIESGELEAFSMGGTAKG